ncbi:ATP-grasp domain-containing protein [Streptomyces sp. NPDC001601]|uniref:ATP-grasp domain-containing protein n=1 Tax=Streptomyces sp. NPDC001601 TaxID=3364592 RepID=UPI0036A0C9A8
MSGADPEVLTDAPAPGCVVLIGASPFGSRAITRLGMSYVLVCDPDEDPTPAAADAAAVHRVAYRTDPGAVRALPRPAGVRAVVAFTELGLLPAAELAELWSVNGVPVSAVRGSRDKLQMRRLLAQSGHPLPCGRLQHVSDVDSTAYPVIVKPVSGVAGLGVHLVTNARDLRVALLATNEPLMWERYAVGQELSVETISQGGRHRVLGITRKVTTGAPHFVEHAHLTPAALTSDEERAISETVIDCLDAIGLTVGPAHTEVVLGTDDVTVIETHTRPGGGRIPLITELVTGLDQYQLAVRAVCGLALPEVVSPSKSAGVRFFSGEPGVVTTVTGLDDARRLQGVVEVGLELARGEAIRAWENNLDRAGFVVCEGRNHGEVEERLDRAVSAIRLVTQ